MNFKSAISAERLKTYEDWANSDNAEGHALYALNVALSEAFYTTLHILEITLRNSIHETLKQVHGDDWFSNRSVINDRYKVEKITQAKAKHNKNTTDGKIVAELTLGFWTSLFSKGNKHLWGQILMPMFDARRPLQRKEIARRLTSVRRLRNRIAHHEPIIHYDLISHHLEANELIGWLSTDALNWCNMHCRFLTVHPKMPIIIGNLKNPALTFE